MLTLKEVMSAAQEGQQYANTLGVKCSITIVDAGGNTLVLVRNENAGFLTPQTSQAKAVAAAAFKKSTKELVELAKSNPQFWSTMPSIIDRAVLPTTGAVPIFRANTCVGAVGVGGGSPDQDHEIAEFVANCLTKK